MRFSPPCAGALPSSKALNSRVAREAGRCFFWRRGGGKKRAGIAVFMAHVQGRCDEKLGNGADSRPRSRSAVSPNPFSRRFKEPSRALARSLACNQAPAYLFVFLPGARLLNQSQPAEVAPTCSCVVSVSHISGVANRRH